MFKVAIARSGIEASQIEDICVGNVLTPSQTYEARSAALAAGIPETTPVQSISRFCSSGLMAVNAISTQIRAGQIEIGLAVGIESMSAQYVTARNLALTGFTNPIFPLPANSPDKGPEPVSEDLLTSSSANLVKESLQPMGWTSENVAEDFNISREDMDAFAALSFQRAEAAERGEHAHY